MRSLPGTAWSNAPSERLPLGLMEATSNADGVF